MALTSKTLNAYHHKELQFQCFLLVEQIFLWELWPCRSLEAWVLEKQKRIYVNMAREKQIFLWKLWLDHSMGVRTLTTETRLTGTKDRSFLQGPGTLIETRVS